MKSGPWAILYSDRREEFRVKAATATIFIVLIVQDCSLGALARKDTGL